MTVRLGKPGPPVLLADLPLNPGDEPPFLRPRSRARPRRARRGSLGRVILAVQVGGALLVALFLTWAGYSKVMASERLKVARVDVRGGRFLSEGEVRELLGPAVGENILTLDIDALKARLRASPWVADATVGRTLPDTLRVEIRERVPLALAEVERLYLMDGEGALVDVYGPRTSGFDLPIVRGLMGCDAEARRDRAQRAGSLLRDLGELGSEVSEVQVEPSGELRVVLRGAGEVLRMGAPPYRKRFAAFLGLRRELVERCPDAEYFDLRFRDRIYAKSLPPRAAAPARPDAGPARPVVDPAAPRTPAAPATPAAIAVAPAAPNPAREEKAEPTAASSPPPGAEGSAAPAGTLPGRPAGEAAPSPGRTGEGPPSPRGDAAATAPTNQGR